MRLSRLVGRTLRQPPADAHLVSHQLLVRAGYVRALDAGLFASLPLGRWAQDRLRALVHAELSRAGAQEVGLPAMAEPSIIDDLIRREIDSYRQLPAVLFDVQVRPSFPAGARAGLFGAVQRLAVDVYAFGSAQPAAVSNSLAAAAVQVAGALDRVAAACGVPVIWADGGEETRHLTFAHPAGDEDVVRCQACAYAAARGWAATTWPAPPDEPQPALEEIETPNCNTIAALAEFMGVPATRTLKMVFYSVAGRVTCVAIRGDRAVDERKLARLLGTDKYYVSTEDELAAIGAVGGYASPIGLSAGPVRVVADTSVRSGRNWITGANRPGYHLRNANVPRDFDPGEWVDLALVQPGDPCPHCGAPLAVDAAFILATGRPRRPAGAEFLDEAGVPQPIRVSSWQLDLGRLLPAIVEGHHDDYGIVWPAACAPLDVHLVALDLRQEPVVARAEALYARLQAAGLAVLYDDRDASAGVKFADADLIGLPLRLTVGKRSVQDGTIEAKWRHSPDRLKLDEPALAAELARLRPAKD